MISAEPTFHLRDEGAEVPAGTPTHQIARVASGIREAARQRGIELNIGYTEAVAADGLSRCDRLGVSRLGKGVVIRTAPESRRELPILLGYAQGHSEWLRSGRRWHSEAEVSR